MHATRLRIILLYVNKVVFRECTQIAKIKGFKSKPHFQFVKNMFLVPPTGLFEGPILSFEPSHFFAIGSRGA